MLVLHPQSVKISGFKLLLSTNFFLGSFKAEYCHFIFIHVNIVAFVDG